MIETYTAADARAALGLVEGVEDVLFREGPESRPVTPIDVAHLRFSEGWFTTECARPGVTACVVYHWCAAWSLDAPWTQHPATHADHRAALDRYAAALTQEGYVVDWAEMGDAGEPYLLVDYAAGVPVPVEPPVPLLTNPYHLHTPPAWPDWAADAPGFVAGPPGAAGTLTVDAGAFLAALIGRSQNTHALIVIANPAYACASESAR